MSDKMKRYCFKFFSYFIKVTRDLNKPFVKPIKNNEVVGTMTTLPRTIEEGVGSGQRWRLRMIASFSARVPFWNVVSQC